MSHDFTAARRAAQHCRELTCRGPRPEERAVLLAAWRRDVARYLAEDLPGLLSGDRLDISVSEPERVIGSAALGRIGPVAANSLLRIGPTGSASGETALAAFDFATAIALTDRSFGGEGKLPDTAPDQLPRSAALLVDEIAATIAQAISRASCGDETPPTGAAPTGEVMMRSESAARLKPFDPQDEALLFTLAISNRQGCEWHCLVAIGAERMDRLLPQPRRVRSQPDGRTRRALASPPGAPPSAALSAALSAPFTAIPLPLHVVLAEVDLSLARLQTLAPGDQLPLAVGRQVPLMLGDKIIAHGSIGTFEDRMALRLTRFPAEGPVS